MFARQDRNGDGQVTMDEMDERTRGFMQRMAQTNGLPENGPWKIDEIRKSFEERAGGGDREGRGRDEGDRGRDGDRDSDEKKDDEAKKPSVPGFGIASLEGAAGRLVPGFGVTTEENGRPSNRTFGALARTSRGGRSDGGRSESSSSSSSGGSSSPTKKPSSKAEEDAQKMIKNNDANNDGKLQADEMDGMFFKPKDANGDGDVSLDELTAQLAKTSGGKTADAKKEAGGGRDRGSSDSGDDSSSKSFRFLTAKERLPKDIPDWFVDADEDEDGQVLMSEYAERWTESVAKKFVGLDLDGDGVITPDEATSGRKSRDR
jgi:Ca2+-binding EF-hand superfamily protein